MKRIHMLQGWSHQMAQLKQGKWDMKFDT